MPRKIGLYIHIPYCRRKCFYCHFTKLPYREETVSFYINALIREIRLRRTQDKVVDSIYVGGGSPSLLPESLLRKIMEALHKWFNFEINAEKTIECNPEDLTKSYALFLKRIGFNRLSIGTQSFNEADLRYLHRDHSCAQNVFALDCAESAGFTNISIDYIIALPGQSRKTLKESLSLLKRFNIDHVSAYILEGINKKGITQNQESEHYFFTRDYLNSMGYLHYELSNFCKSGKESVHNLKYWQNGEYVGLGLSASGFENNWDYRNLKQSARYFSSVNQNKLPQAIKKKHSPEQRHIITGLRLIGGIPEIVFNKFKRELAFLISNNFLIRRDKNIAVHPQKILVLNEILTYFL